MSVHLHQFFHALFGAEPGGARIELRLILPGQTETAWFLTSSWQAAADRAVRLAAETNVYVGVAPRYPVKRDRPVGGRDAIRHAHVLWADVDGADALDVLSSFRPLPSIVVASGSGGAHAYWALNEPLAHEPLGVGLRRLAQALDADRKCAEVARVLRPPGTLNHKHDPPRAVELVHIDPELVYTAAEVVGHLADPPSDRPSRVGEVSRYQSDDHLFEIPPPVYVEALTGRIVGGDGKVLCPLPGHDERTPSFHVYDDPDKGWFCFGCERGGGVIDLGAALWGIEPRGAGFHEICERTAEVLNLNDRKVAA